MINISFSPSLSFSLSLSLPLLLLPSLPPSLPPSLSLSPPPPRRAMLVGGTCTGEHGVGLGKRDLLIEEFGEDAINVMKQLKLTFDPNNIMNPGKVIYL